MIVRISWLGLVGLAIALAQNPPAPGPGPRPHFGPPPGGPFAGARFLGAEAGMPGRVVTNAPFTADVVTETTQTLSDGTHIKQNTTVHFSRDSQGRTRREESLTSLGTNRTVVFIEDPVAGASYALDAVSKTANRSMRPAGGRGQGRGMRPQMAGGGPGQGRGAGRGFRANQNIKTESLGTQTIEGVAAQGTRTTMTIPAGQIGNDQPIQIVTERWYSADLQTTVLTKRSDPRTGETVTRYTNVVRAEPVPTLFQVPADYKVQDVGRGPRSGGQGQ